MKLTVENTLGIVRAEVDLEPGQIVEVVGPNASGKTSLAVCAQAVLARDSNPLGLSAADAKRSYPHDGAEDARVSLDLLHNGIELEWFPVNGKVIGPTIPACISRPEAVGLIDFTAKRGAKERAAVFQGALLPDPDSVLAAIKEKLAVYLPADDLAGAMKMLKDRGWEATEAVYADRAKVSKRDWRDITGKTYGVRVAADWRPDGWLADYDHMTPQIAEEKVVVARDMLNALHRVQAVSESEAEAIATAKRSLPGLRGQVETLEGQRIDTMANRDAIPTAAIAYEHKQAKDELDEARRNLRDEQECPHCKKPLVVIQGKVTIPAENPATRLTELEIKLVEVAEKYTEVEVRAEPFTIRLQDMDKDLAIAKRDLAVAEAAAKRTGEVQSESDRAALASAEQAVEDARDVVKLIQAESDATRLHETVVRYTEIAKALGPEGVRAKMLADGLRKLNAGLTAIAKESGWPVTAVSDSGGIVCGERPVQLCSESERWRTQAAIQLTLAAMTGSKAVVLDRVDLLDASNRKGLESALQRVAGKTNMAILLCGTGNARVRLTSAWPIVEISDGKTAEAVTA